MSKMHKVIKSWSITTKMNKKTGLCFTYLIQEKRNGNFLGQLTRQPGKACDPYGLRIEEVVLDNFNSLIDACEGIGYPYDILGLPELME